MYCTCTIHTLVESKTAPRPPPVVAKKLHPPFLWDPWTFKSNIVNYGNEFDDSFKTASGLGGRGFLLRKN